MTLINENKEAVEQQPATNARKLDHDMSMAPFLGVGKIEYEETYKNFEDEFTKLEKSFKMDFFKVEKDIEPMLTEGALVVVDTKKYRTIFNNKPGFECKKFRTSDDHRYNTTFHTWQEIVDILALWKKEKFNPNLIVEPNVHCINRNFRHVHIFKHKRGYLFANQFDMTYPHEIMQSCIILGKK